MCGGMQIYRVQKNIFIFRQNFVRTIARDFAPLE